VKPRSTGPLPERTARGFGRPLTDRVADRRAGVRVLFFVVLRDREVGVLRLFAAFEALGDAALLREPGGEDVRVAMVRNLGQRHSSHTDHTRRALGRV
jgi:hypothetical protein